MKLALGAKMTGVVVGVMVLGATVALGVTSIFERQRLTDLVEQRMGTISETARVAALARLAERQDAYANLQPLVEDLVSLSGIAWIQVLDESGRTLAHTQRARVGREASGDDRASAARALTEGRPLDGAAADGSPSRFLPVVVAGRNTPTPSRVVVQVVLLPASAPEAFAEADTRAVTETVVDAVRSTLANELAHTYDLRLIAEHLVRLPTLVRLEVYDATGEVVARADAGIREDLSALDLFGPASRVLTEGRSLSLPGVDEGTSQRFVPIERPVEGESAERLGAVAMVFDDSHLRVQVDEHRRQLLTVLLGIVLAVGLATIASLRLLVGRPIERLASATSQVADGSVGVEVPVGSKDEVGQLARAFNRMTRALGEQTVSRRYFESVLHGIREGVLTTAPDGTVAFANRAASELVGTPVEGLVGQPLDAILALKPAELEASPDGLAVARETSLVQHDGTRIPVLVSATRLGGAAPGTTVWVVEDLSERRDLEEQLRHAQKMDAIGRLAGGIAHDYNNYLTVITGFAEALERALPEGDKKRELVQHILQAAESSAGLTRRLLEFGRRQPIRPKLLELGERITRMHDVLARVLGERVTIETSIDDERATVRMDPSQLEQVVLNLAVNAKDAMPDGGRLRIASRRFEVDAAFAARHPGLRTGPHVALLVEDQGVGMDSATRARAFEPFFTTKPPGRGTGLGLASVYGIVTQAGGVVEVDSEPGVGTTFQVILPCGEDEPDPITVETNVPSPAASAGSATVLLVEDQDMVRDLTREVLRRAGYRVVEARDGEDALAKVGDEARGVDLLLTDVVMPRMGGRELAARLGSRRPDLPVIFMSGYDAVRAEGRKSKLGEIWLQKPFRSEQLLDAVRVVLGRIA